MKLFERFFCKHQWKTIQEIRDKYVFIGGSFYIIIQQCEKCGKINKIVIL